MVWLEADIARVDCRRCGRVRTEQVPWARPGARLTRDLEGVIAWLAQRTDKTSICRLLRVSWQTVHRTVARVVADHLDDTRLDNLYRLGVDEIAYKRGHHYLTVIANHDNGRVVWVSKGRNHSVLHGFFDALGPARCALVEAISMDMAKVWQQPCADNIPQAAVCFDPFHVIKWANEALNSVYRATAHQRTDTSGRAWRLTRYALYTGAERLNDSNRELINALRRSRYGYGAPGTSKNASGISTTASTRPTRPGTCGPGAAPRPSAASGHSSTSPAESGRTSTASSPRSAMGCPTAVSKASTPKSASSTSAATATPTTNPSPP
jgi:transposase